MQFHKTPRLFYHHSDKAVGILDFRHLKTYPSRDMRSRIFPKVTCHPSSLTGPTCHFDLIPSTFSSIHLPSHAFPPRSKSTAQISFSLQTCSTYNAVPSLNIPSLSPLSSSIPTSGVFVISLVSAVKVCPRFFPLS